MLDTVLERLGRDRSADHCAIASAWLGVAEHDVKYGTGREGLAIARRVSSMLDAVPDTEALRERARALKPR